MSPWCKNLKPFKVFDFAHDPNLSLISTQYFSLLARKSP